MQVTGQGWDLFRESITIYNKELSFDIENVPGTLELKKWQLEKKFNDQSHKIVLEQALADVITVQFDTIVSKHIELYVSPEILRSQIKANHIVNSVIKIEPSHILIQGPKAIMDTVPDSISLVLPDFNINGEYDEEVDLPLAKYRFVTSEIGSSNVRFEVSKQQSYTLKVPITLSSEGFRDSSVVSNPWTTNIDFLGLESVNYQPKDFVIDARIPNKFREGDTSQVQLRIIQKPEFTSIQRLYDSTVTIYSNVEQ